MIWNNIYSFQQIYKEKKFDEWCIKNKNIVFSNPYDEWFERKNEKTFICVKKGEKMYITSTNKGVEEENEINSNINKMLEHVCNKNGNQCTFARFENIFICKYSHQIHRCSKEECEYIKKTNNDNIEGYNICPISGFVTIKSISGFNTIKEENCEEEKNFVYDINNKNKKKRKYNEKYPFLHIWNIFQVQILNQFFSKKNITYININNNSNINNENFYSIEIEEKLLNYQKKLYNKIKKFCLYAEKIYLTFEQKYINNNDQNKKKLIIFKQIDFFSFTLTYILYCHNKKNIFNNDFIIFLKNWINTKEQSMQKKIYNCFFLLKNI